MGLILAFLLTCLVFIGGVLAYSSAIIWFIHAIYQLIKTDIGFFTVVGLNLLGFVLQLVVGVVIASVSAIGLTKLK